MCRGSRRCRLRSPTSCRFCLQLTTQRSTDFADSSSPTAAAAADQASATVLGRGSAPHWFYWIWFWPWFGPGRTGSFGSTFGRHAVWESPFEQLERRVGDEASALLALLASANSSGLVSHTQLRVGWLRYAEEQQQQQQDGNDGNRTELFARLKDIASARHGIAVEAVT